MSIPKHDEIRIPALNLLKTGEELKLKDFIQPLAEYYKLSDAEISEKYPSGNAHIFYDRISWALSYLYMAKLLDKPKRGIYQINPKGLELLKKPHEINSYIEQALAEREPLNKQKKQLNKNNELTINKDLSGSTFTPQENLYTSYSNIKKSVYSDILTTILSKKASEFEKLVVLLLQKMGYGGEIKDSGSVTRYSNDGGIDGIVKEDILGFGRIYIQAKCYKPEITIGREDIQKFVGALAVAQSNKGVFITTSSFSKGAIDYVENLNGSTTIVLIDGKQLAEYIYEYGLGMQTEQLIEIKKLDFDFWDSMAEKN